VFEHIPALAEGGGEWERKSQDTLEKCLGSGMKIKNLTATMRDGHRGGEKSWGSIVSEEFRALRY